MVWVLGKTADRVIAYEPPHDHNPELKHAWKHANGRHGLLLDLLVRIQCHFPGAETWLIEDSLDHHHGFAAYACYTEQAPSA